MVSLSLRKGSEELTLLNSFENHYGESSIGRTCPNRTNGYSIKYACNGHESYWIRGKKLHLAPGEALFINHSLSATNRSQNDYLSKGLCLFYSEQEMKRLCSSLFSAGAVSYESLEKLSELKIVRTSDICLSLASLFRNYNGPKSNLRQDLIHLLWTDFLKGIDPSIIEISSRLRSMAPSTRQSLIRKFQLEDQFMSENLSQNLQLEDIATHIGMSPFHFQRQYKKATGFSPSRKLVKYRMEKAKELIMAGNLRIVEIATFLAYNDLPTFSKAFKREFGLSPMQWKRML